MRSLKRTFGFILDHPLAKTNLIPAFWRFFKWQLISRFKRNLIALPFVDQVKILARKGLAGATGNIYTGLHEFEDMGFLLHFLREGDLFIDVGANIGSYTLLASGVKRCRTISFEPGQPAFSILQKNIQLNGLQELVICVNKAVGSETSELFFSEKDDTTNHIVLPGSVTNNSLTVDVTTLDELNSQTIPSLIKIDVEGFEMEVLKGAAKMLQQPAVKALIIELNGSGLAYGHQDSEIHEMVMALGFRAYLYDPFSRLLTPLADYGDKNTVYIRDKNFVSERLSSSKPFKVLGRSI